MEAALAKAVAAVGEMSQELADLTHNPVEVDLTVGSNLDEPKEGDLWRGRVMHKSKAKMAPSHVFRAKVRTLTVVMDHGDRIFERMVWVTLCGVEHGDPVVSPNRDGTPPLCKRCEQSLAKMLRDGPDKLPPIQGYTTWTFMPNEDGSGGHTPWSTLGQSQEEASNDN